MRNGPDIPVNAPDDRDRVYVDASGGPASGEMQNVRWSELLAVLVVFFAAGFLIHYPGLNSPMIYDSKAFIQNQDAVFAQHDLRQVMGIVPVRPLFVLSLYLNYLLTGMDPFFFRLTNLLILAATGACLTVLSMLILNLPSARVPGTALEKKWLSGLIGLWFVIHPLQTLVVLYIWQREAILACFFYFAAVALYVAVRADCFQRRTLAYVVLGVTFFAGMLTKENVATLPVIFLLAELTFFRQSLNRLVVRGLTIAAISLPPLVAYALVTKGIQKTNSVVPPGIVERLLSHYQESGLTVFQVLLTECRVVFSYLLSILVPFLTGTPLLEAQTVSTSLITPPITVLAVTGIVAFLATGVALMRKRPLYAFGMLFFLVVLVPECLLIPLYLFFGYRAIIPMGGVFLVLGGAFLGLIQFLKAMPRSKVFGAVTAALVVVPVIALGATTWSISRHWGPLSFWKTANDQLPPYSDQVEQIPYLQVLLNYGLELLDTGNYPEAIKVLKRAAFMAPDVERALSAKQTGQSEPSAHHEKYSPLRNILTKHPGTNASLFALGLATIKSGNSPEGISYLEFVVRRDPTNQGARLALANALMKTGNTAEGIDNLKRAVAAQPGSVAARIDLGLAYKRVGNLSGAIDLFQQAVAIDPSSGIAYFNLARALEETGKLPQALERYRSAVQFMPASPEAHYCLANALLKSGNAAEAIREFQRAVQLKPDYAEAHANLGAALLGAGQASDAVASFEKALTLIKDNAELYNALGVALAETGQNQRAMDQFKRALALQPSHASARENLERLATAHGKRPPEPENKGSGLP